MFRIFVFGILFLIAHQIQSQDPYYIQYNTENGLPSNEVYDMELDSSGLIWFTTDRGVCTYNGYDFNVFTTKDGLSDNTNFKIFKDSKNRLWFNGFNGSLSYYDALGFHPYKYNVGLRQLINENGFSWVGDIEETYDDEFIFIADKAETEKVYSFSINKKPTTIDDKNLVYSTHNEFSILTFDSLNVVFYEYDSSRLIKFKGDIFNGGLNEKLVRLDQAIYQLDEYALPKNIFRHDGNILCCKKIDDKTILVGTSQGLFQVNLINGNYSAIHLFEDLVITDILIDSDNRIWLSTQQSGIIYIPDFNLKTYFSNINKDRFLSIGTLNNKIITGSSNGIFYQIDTLNNANILYENLKEKSLQIRFIEEDKKNNTLYTSMGVNIISKDNELITKEINKYYVLQKQLKNGDIIKNSTGGVTIGLDEQQIILTQKISSKVIQDEDENIWIGTHDGLLKIVDYDYENPIEIYDQSGQKLGRISDLELYQNKHLWVSTLGQGIYYFHADTLINLSINDGLRSNLVNRLWVSKENETYAATNFGLSRITLEPEKGVYYPTIKNLNKTHGLNSNFINDVTFNNSKIWVATNAGVCAIDESIFDRHAPLTRTSVTSISSHKKNLTDLNNDIVFEHEDNDISISYIGHSYIKNSNFSTYRIRLFDNADDKNKMDWFYTNNRIYSTLNLPSGEYTFEVQSNNNDNVWGKSSIVKFKIESHITEKLWFKGFIVILLIVGLYTLYKLIKRRITINTELKNAHLKIKESELMALRNQMNPHFVFNSLNSIQNFIFKKDVVKANYYLSKFSDLIRKSLIYSRLDFISLENELDFINTYIELEKLRFNDSFFFHLSIDPTLELEEILIPSLLIQPVLENSIKHAFMNINTQGVLRINIGGHKENQLKIVIQDNGPGIKEKNIVKKTNHKSVGLHIVKNRIELLNALSKHSDITMNSENIIKGETIIGYSTTFVLTIKRKYD